jgi:ssDNA-binding Zn-finger/Zn-ribbon topoisomerase 1
MTQLRQPDLFEGTEHAPKIVGDTCPRCNTPVEYYETKRVGVTFCGCSWAHRDLSRADATAP